MSLRPTLAVLLLLGLPAAARADIAVLANGQTLKVSASRQAEGLVWLTLKDGGEVALPSADVQGLVPDEFIEAVLEEMAAAPAGSDLRALAAAAAQRHGLPSALVLA